MGVVCSVRVWTSGVGPPGASGHAAPSPWCLAGAPGHPPHTHTPGSVPQVQAILRGWRPGPGQAPQNRPGLVTEAGETWERPRPTVGGSGWAPCQGGRALGRPPSSGNRPPPPSEHQVGCSETPSHRIPSWHQDPAERLQGAGTREGPSRGVTEESGRGSGRVHMCAHTCMHTGTHMYTYAPGCPWAHSHAHNQRTRPPSRGSDGEGPAGPGAQQSTGTPSVEKIMPVVGS